MSQWVAQRNVALVGVDIQNDFCPGGNLAVPEGDTVVQVFNKLRDHFHVVALTQDYHPAGHSSFASQHEGKEPLDTVKMPYGEQTLWPDHCVQATEGAEFHPDLDIRENDLIIQKGTRKEIDSYSAHYENDHETPPTFDDGKTLTETMRERGVDTLVFTGLARDFCVGYSALDAIKDGFNAIVVIDGTKAIGAPINHNETTDTAMIAQLKEAGAKIVHSNQLHATLTA